MLRPSPLSTNAAERICYYLGARLIDACTKETLKAVDYESLTGSRARRFKSALRREGGSALFAAFAHGNQDALVLGGAWVIKRGDGPIFSGKMCAMVACCSLEGLGRAMVAAGALGAVGFRKEVRVWPFEDSRLATLGNSFVQPYISWMLRPRPTKSFANAIRAELQSAIDHASNLVRGTIQSDPIERWKDFHFIGLLREIKETIDYV